MRNLNERISGHLAVIGVIGLGYVGLPLAMAFAKQFTVVGYDTNTIITDLLKKGISHIQDVSSKSVSKYSGTSFYPTSNSEDLQRCDIFIICVPTPLDNENDPDLKYVKSAAETIVSVLRPGQFIILESTTYPGTTEEVLIPILEETGFKAGLDFGVAYSPERIDPGNNKYSVEEIPKVVGGINEECTSIAASLYGTIIQKVISVKNARTAEAVKMVENIFRNVNIALINEMALIFERMDIDTWETVDAAASKPYGYMPFYPGPGIGGHCIPLDPYYLSYKAKKYGFIPRFIETSGEINHFMKIHVVNLVEKALNRVGKSVYKSKIAVFGLAYKKNIDDIRETPATYIIEELVNLGAEIRVYDPRVSTFQTKFGLFNSYLCTEDALLGADCAVFLIDHDQFRNIDPKIICELMRSPVLVDCKNIFSEHEGLIYYGIGKGTTIA